MRKLFNPVHDLWLADGAKTLECQEASHSPGISSHGLAFESQYVVEQLSFQQMVAFKIFTEGD